MIDLDPAIVDQETLRKKRRKKMLLISLVPEIILVVSGIFFLRPLCADVLFRMNFDTKNGGAVTVARMQQFANLIEPYIAHYNAGTALIQQNSAKDAEKELRQSLANNPPQNKVCQVRVNLSYSIEMQADDAKSHSRFDEALALYSKAEGVLYENNCASKNNKKERANDSHAEEAKTRIGGKRNQVISAMDGGDDGGDSGGSSGDGGQQKNVELDSKAIQSIREMLENGPTIRNRIIDNNTFGAGDTGGSGRNDAVTNGNW